MTRTGEREIGVVSGRLPHNPGELACMLTPEEFHWSSTGGKGGGGIRVLK